MSGDGEPPGQCEDTKTARPIAPLYVGRIAISKEIGKVILRFRRPFERRRRRVAGRRFSSADVLRPSRSVRPIVTNPLAVPTASRIMSSTRQAGAFFN